ncbi:MAG: SMC-Scp complex subunit ScpB [Bosea sp. (in: a-proteobacteria)]
MVAVAKRTQGTAHDGPVNDHEDEAQEAAHEAHALALRITEALIFASASPVKLADIAAQCPAGADMKAVMADLVRVYDGRGVELAQVAGGYAFRTAPDLGYLLKRDTDEPRKLTRAAMETLAIIAYHQPVTRTEIEEIRGVATSKGTLDLLMETGWIKMRGRRKTPGRPITYGSTPGFLDQFGLDRIDDLPGLEELKGAGFIDGRLPSDITVPSPDDSDTLRDDEDALGDLLHPLDPDEAGQG